MSTIWTPLHKAFEHVLQHERSRELTEYRLRRVLGTPKSGPQVRSRAGVVLTPMQPQRELENVMLPGEFWLEEAVYDGEADGGAIVNWQEDSARLSASHPFAPWLVDGIERLVPSSDGGDDFVGVCGPCEGLRFGVGLGEEAVDGGLEVDDGAEDAAFQAAPG